MISIVCVVPALSLALGAWQTPTVPLTRRAPERRVYEQGKTRFFYGRDVPLQDAMLINDFVAVHVMPENVAKIDKAPLPDNLFLVSAWAGTSVADTRRVFLLLRKQGSEIRELQRSRGWLGDWILEPTFFVGRDRILVVAELASEEYGHLEAFEFFEQRLRYLGAAYVAGKSEDGKFISPLREATAEYSNQRYLLNLKGELFDISQREAMQIARKGEPLSFSLRGERFVPVPKGAR